MSKENTNRSLIAIRGASDDTGLEQYIREVQRFPILTAEEEYNLAKDWIDSGDKLAAEKLVTSHLRLVVSVAYEFRHYGLPISDLISEGNIGLMQAVKKFDPDKGFRLTTYAMWWIKAAIYESILSNWSIVKIGNSSNQKKLFFNLSRAKKQLGIIDSGKLTDSNADEIAGLLGVSSNEVKKMSSWMTRHISLNQTKSNDEDEGELIDDLSDTKQTSEEALERKEMNIRGAELLRKHLSDLSEREQDIIKARYLSDPVITLEDLALKYSVSKERVRQIAERAYEKLKLAILEDAKDMRSVLTDESKVKEIEYNEDF